MNAKTPSHSVKNLFRLDAIGALFSALMLGGVLPNFAEVLGAPASMLYMLAILPVGFAAYDLHCLQRNPVKPSLLLVIAAMNAAYVLISIGFLWWHADVLKPLGWAYFSVEIAVVAALAGPPDR